MEKSDIQIVRWDKEKNIIFIKIKEKLYKAKIVSINKEAKELTVYIFNSKTTLTIPLTEDAPKKIENKTSSNITDKILSPIAGRIIKINIKENELVDKNSPIITIESMKMENEIRAPFPLFVKSIHIKVGDLVKQKQLLITIEKQ